MARGRPNFFTVLWRGLRRRCPRCGGGDLFVSYFRMRERCPSCELPTERGEGFWLGGMAINLGLTELVFGGFLLGSILLTWPDPPWALILIAGVLINAVLPVVLYPVAKAVFLGVDMLMFRLDPMRRPPPSPYEMQEPPAGPS